MNNITMTVELCAEDRARLDKILEALASSRNCQACVDTITKYVAAEVGQHIKQPAEAHPVADPFPEPAPAPEAPVEPEPVKAEAPAVTSADVQRLVVQLSAAGKKDQVREIVNSYAPRVSAIPEDKLVEAWDRLAELGSQK